MISVLITIFGLGIVIFVHELGHLISAKKTGIGVYEFSIGFGPRIFRKKYNGTEYGIRLIPFGGFIKLAGMDDEENAGIFKPEESYYSKPVYKRIITIASGPFMNIFLAFIIFVLMFSIIGIPRADNVVDEAFTNSPAKNAGIKKGDKIISLNGNKIVDMEKDGIMPILRSRGKEIKLEIKRNGKNIIVLIKPEYNKKKNISLIGIKLESTIKRQNPVMAIYYGVLETYYETKLTLMSLKMLLSGKATFKDMVGPIGIVQVATHQVRRGVISFLQLISLISINLGILNILPFPVLDGGHLMFLSIEAVRRKPLSRKVENLLNTMGAMAIIMLMLIVVLNDIIRWSNRSEMLNKLEKTNIITPQNK